MQVSAAPKTVRSREKILLAATALFAARGFGGTSTRDVARKARVNETTVFRLFKNKKELYLRVLDDHIGVCGHQWPRLVSPSIDEPGKAFLTLISQLKELFDPIVLRLLFYVALENPKLLRTRYRPRLVSLYESLAQHVRDNIDTEDLRIVDAVSIGRALLGMIAYHHIIRDLLGSPDFVWRDSEPALRTCTTFWLQGALTEDPAAHYKQTASAARISRS